MIEDSVEDAFVLAVGSLSISSHQSTSTDFYLFVAKKTYYQHRQMPLRCELPLLWSIVKNEVSLVSVNETRVPTQLEHITSSLRPAPYLTLSLPTLQQIVSGPSTLYSFLGSLGSRSRATEVITYLLLLPVRWSPVFLILGYSLQNQEGLRVASKTTFFVPLNYIILRLETLLVSKRKIQLGLFYDMVQKHSTVIIGHIG